MSATSLNDNIYIAFILSAVVELPAYFIAIWFMDHWGRKPTLILCLFLGGVCCIPAGFAPGTLQTVLVLIGNTSQLITIQEKVLFDILVFQSDSFYYVLTIFSFRKTWLLGSILHYLRFYCRNISNSCPHNRTRSLFNGSKDRFHCRASG